MERGKPHSRGRMNGAPKPKLTAVREELGELDTEPRRSKKEEKGGGRGSCCHPCPQRKEGEWGPEEEHGQRVVQTKSFL